MDVEMPLGIRAVMWLSLFIAVAGSIILVVTLVMLVRGDVTAEPFLRRAVSTVVTVAICWWIALAIRAEHAYVRPLLIALVAGELVFMISKAVAERGFPAEQSTNMGDEMALFALLLFYLLRKNGTVAQYYAHLRARAHG
jgi:hypothetical protein